MTLPPSGAPLRDALLSPRSIPAEVRKRMSPDHFITVQPRQIPEREADGWVIDKRNKRSARMRKPKLHDVAFEDRVWAAFAKLNFTSLNKDRDFALRFGNDARETQQVNVFAADDEVVLVIICRSSETVRTGQFRKELETVQTQRPGFLKEIKKDFPYHKVKFILATNNFGVTQPTAERIEQADVIHMDEDVIDYYIGLADHLGRAARYQLLGNLFHGTKIPNLDPEVVAIEAHMGGHKYYSFSIEPERLLKLAYILHRNKANSTLMPTYQRLIKKTRLKGVAQFVDDGGYFPNSLILSLDSVGRGLKFEPFPKHAGETRAGVLHLPQTFRAAYVIDGQHRLYGYADSSRAATDLIPVIAFVNLERPDQVRLFMQINENQQAVPKNLRNTLNADLLYDSKDLREQIRALKLHIAQQLGEDKSSPLYGRIQIGESPKTALRCLTIDAISRGIERGGFLGSFAKTEVKEVGSFYRGSNDATAGPLIAYLTLGLTYLRDGLDTQFKLGSAEGGFVFINNGIESLIRILGDIAEHLTRENGYNPRESAPQELFDAARPYMDPLISHLASLDSAQGLEFRQMYGSGAGTKYWRRVQQAISIACPDFMPAGLAEYLESEEKQFNDESRDMVAALGLFMKGDIRKRLENEYGSTWRKDGVPRRIMIEAGKLAVEKNADLDADHELEAWDCLYVVDYRAIMTQSQDLWKRLFEKQYTRPGDEDKPGGWRARSDWIQRLNDLRNDVMHERTVTSEDHDFLVTLTTWLIKGQADNDL
ncbi:DGQHR domain-containing protein [Kribbella pittospori]|uniref:DGQHR domain-containing protein n=1 Tax=Kribbella pittospori TaxID=722689 RepID=A0A4R0K644_9ACTN|nr:DGQHR domain-containing protein [Kribbella pittospori]